MNNNECLKYLADAIFRKLTSWQIVRAEAYKVCDYDTDYENGHIDAYASCLDLINDLSNNVCE